ncbi:MAG TPA: trans-4-hydroxy-L-proline dehydratase [Rectinemataceae bacterium]|nr:trans-4-hydroxy-L-proline dehydratase [Rectinemataceae bacterium]
MNERIARLREESFSTRPSFSAERALLTTEFYREWQGRVSVPVLRAMNFRNLCERKTIYIGPDELIVGERGPRPKAVSSFPELTCHSEEDLKILDSRPMTSYAVPAADLDIYREKVIPYWRGRSMRDRAFAAIPEEWKDLYDAGLFTEFMEQRAPGHTSLDGSIYRKGMLDFKADIARSRAALDWAGDPGALDKDEELTAMDISCDAAIIFAERHAALAETMAETERGAQRAAELRRIAEVCRRVPAQAPRDFWEAIQMYWFVHLGTITELNGWDAMSPGHFDQHLAPFYGRELAAGSLDREGAKELLACFWIKVNNTPAPPKVGVTAAESGTYNDFTNINIGGLSREGDEASSEVSYLLLEVLDELQLLQPQANLQVSAKTPDRLLESACRVVRRGSGYPSLFNADEVVMAQVGMGKRIEDAREGGTSGCIETGCFGKEAYLLHGYLNVPKVLELALNDGVDPMSGKRVAPPTGDPRSFSTFEELYSAFERQLGYVVDTKIRVSNYLDRMFARYAPAPFLSVLIADCIGQGRDYYDGGARYNTDYVQCCGLGTTTDSLSALKKHVFEEGRASMGDMLAALRDDWKGREDLRLLVTNKTAKFGNDDDYADSLAERLFETLFRAIDGRRSPRGGVYHIDLLSTTCHVYFGLRTGATADGRRAHAPESDGTSPAQGADRAGPTAVIRSLAKLDIARTGGSLLNQRFQPATLAGDEGLRRMASLVRSYFRLGGHHIQFNVVDSETLRAAQARPEDYRNLLVRVAGYSDYFVDLDRNHQEEIISRTAQEGF